MLTLIKKMSPAAWRHIHLNGYYRFRGDGQIIDLDAIIAGLDVLVQPEMERRRSPLMSIPPFGRGFSRHWGLPIRCGVFEKRGSEAAVLRSSSR